MTHTYQWFDDIDEIINQRKQAGKTDDSYTARLFQKGLIQIAKKVGEEGTETALAAVAESPERFQNEVADLLFHLMVLLNAKGIKMSEIMAVLEQRHTTKQTH